MINKEKMKDKIKWTLATKKISDLEQYHKNPRYIKEQDLRQLQTSIDKFGLIDKPILNSDDIIIGGHQRINALKESGIKTVECWVPNRLLDEKEVEELNIRLNKNSGDWDWDVLANEWNLDDLLQLGFTEVELDIAGIDEVDSKEPKEEEKDKTISCPKCGHEFLK